MIFLAHIRQSTMRPYYVDDQNQDNGLNLCDKLEFDHKTFNEICTSIIFEWLCGFQFHKRWTIWYLISLLEIVENSHSECRMTFTYNMHFSVFCISTKKHNSANAIDFSIVPLLLILHSHSLFLFYQHLHWPGWFSLDSLGVCHYV